MNEEIEKLVQGGDAALGELFEFYRGRLERIVEFRIDPRLHGRVDPDDVLQEAWLNASRRLQEFLSNPAVSLFVWLRQLSIQALIDLHRRHFGQKRDPRAEIHFTTPSMDESTSQCLVSALAGQMTSPSQAISKLEEMEKIRKILDAMDPIDREVIALRHFEQMTNNQVAEALGLSITAASNRYIRAMTKLSAIVTG